MIHRNNNSNFYAKSCDQSDDLEKLKSDYIGHHGIKKNEQENVMTYYCSWILE